MGRYIARRLLQAAVLVFVVASLVAVFIHLLPGDPAYNIVPEGQATPERIAIVRQQLGLDQPILKQYGTWISHAARGDLGASLFTTRSVTTDLGKRLPRSIELTIVAVLLGVVVGIPLGLIAAVYRNGFLDWFISILGTLGAATPVFVIGTLLTLAFGVKLHWLPSTGYVAFSEDPAGHIKRIILPAITLAILLVATTLRITRSALLEVLGADYVRTARAKGLAEPTVLQRHALKNALLPVISVIGVQLGSLIGGSVIVEFIFNWPGVGSYLITGISQRDYPVVQGVVLVIATLFILLNLITDLIYAWVDPRVSYGN
jgi:peptide/nickel transport system permease protein